MRPQQKSRISFTSFIGTVSIDILATMYSDANGARDLSYTESNKGHTNGYETLVPRGSC